jgi:methylenetetrahydrofolate--tRNA-(uracil-5-)-methyltransferase
MAGVNTWADLAGSDPVVLPQTTALGALLAYATDPQTSSYQPMHVNFGLVPPLDPPVRGKRSRYAAYAERARNDLAEWIGSCPAFADRNLR